jgi:hypothetical protein
MATKAIPRTFSEAAPSNEASHKLAVIPPLENGDHLRRAEFERRYQAMPWLKKADLIEGVVYEEHAAFVARLVASS